MWWLLGLTGAGIAIKMWAARRLWQSRHSELAALAIFILLAAFSQSVLELLNYYHLVSPDRFDMTMILNVHLMQSNTESTQRIRR